MDAIAQQILQMKIALAVEIADEFNRGGQKAVLKKVEQGVRDGKISEDVIQLHMVVCAALERFKELQQH